MKSILAIFSLLTISYAAHAEGLDRAVTGPAIPIVQQTIEITLNKDWCPMNSEGRPNNNHYYSFCSISGYRLNLPPGGRIIGSLDSNEFRVVVDGGSIFIETKDRNTDFATIKAMLLIGKSKIKVIYQGPQL